MRASLAMGSSATHPVMPPLRMSSSLRIRALLQGLSWSLSIPETATEF
jgi:hypothetical protein